MPEIQESAASLKKKKSGYGNGYPETLTLTRSRTRKSQGQCSTAHSSMLPGAAQWEEMMRKFSQAHKESCLSVPDDLPRITRSMKTFPTGSTYAGTWNPLGMSGQGTYTFPHKGVVYKGGFDDGAFHGDGELYYECGAIIKGKWNKGKLIERHLFFSDGLEYVEEDWAYCRPFDRRFTVEYDNGLEPADLTYKTADQPPPIIPPGHYDVGYGFYDTVTKSVYKYNDPTSIESSPDERTVKWIENNCRKNPDLPVGPCPFLYEQWLMPTETLVPEPLPILRCQPAEHEERESEVNIVTEKLSDTKQLSKHRPKGKLFVSRCRLSSKGDFYDPHFINSKSELNALSGSKLGMELLQSQNKEENNKKIELLSPTPSEVLRKRPSVGFNLRTTGSVSQITAIKSHKQDSNLDEKTISSWGLTHSDLGETEQKRLKTENAEENKDSSLSTSAHNVYEQDSEDVMTHHKSVKLNVDSIHLKHTQVNKDLPQDSVTDSNINTQGLVSQSEHQPNAEVLVQGSQAQVIEQNEEQERDSGDQTSKDIQVIEASAQDPTAGGEISTQGMITQPEHQQNSEGDDATQDNNQNIELAQDPEAGDENNTQSLVSQSVHEQPEALAQ